MRNTTALRIASPVLVFLFNTGLTVSGFVNLTVAIVSWALMIPALLVALLWPRISPWIRAGDTQESVVQERQRRKDKYQEWCKQIQEMVFDDNPLTEARYDDPRLRMAQNLTREALRWQDSEGKRDVLLNLYNWSLIRVYPGPVVGLKYADFSGANLEGVDLRCADLGHVNLRDADLRDARLGAPPENDSEMNPLMRVIKRLAGSESCDLQDANLGGADLRGADLRGTHNLTQEQVNEAYGSYQQKQVPDTQLPRGLTAPELWRKSIHKQKRKRTLARLERAHAGP